jgi:hypothetical protein
MTPPCEFVFGGYGLRASGSCVGVCGPWFRRTLVVIVAVAPLGHVYAQPLTEWVREAGWREAFLCVLTERERDEEGHWRTLGERVVGVNPATGEKRDIVFRAHSPAPHDDRLRIAPGGWLINYSPHPERIRAVDVSGEPVGLTATAQPAAALSSDHQTEGFDLSPDGQAWVAAVVAERSRRRSVVLRRGEQSRVFALGKMHWTGEVAPVTFSWNPDCSQAAFYFSDGAIGDTPAFQDHGVAVVSMEGGLVRLVEPSGVGTGYGNAKQMPPQWDSTGTHVYFAAGRRDEDHWKGQPNRRGRLIIPPACTYRVNTETREIEKVSYGVLMSLAPDDRTVYVDAYPVGETYRSSRVRAARVDLETEEVRLLPEGAHRPLVSPCGELVAVFMQDAGLRFVDARTLEFRDEGAIALPLPDDYRFFWRTFKWVAAQDGPTSRATDG